MATKPNSTSTLGNALKLYLLTVERTRKNTPEDSAQIAAWTAAVSAVDDALTAGLDPVDIIRDALAAEVQRRAGEADAAGERVAR